jgi:hypothetical protein
MMARAAYGKAIPPGGPGDAERRPLELGPRRPVRQRP